MGQDDLILTFLMMLDKIEQTVILYYNPNLSHSTNSSNRAKKINFIKRFLYDFILFFSFSFFHV